MKRFSNLAILLAMRESPSSPRMFKNNLLDFFSRSPWWTVPLIWLPVSSLLFLTGQEQAQAPSLGVAFFVLAMGLASWTLSEYLLHRFIFHWQGSSKWAKYAHFYIHGVHHQWPSDHYRLVVPPAAGIALSLPFGLFFYLVIGKLFFYPFFSGYLIGYTWYECTHYAVHHLKVSWPWFKKLKRHHLLHHFSDHYREKNFGVSSPIWDSFFKTK